MKARAALLVIGSAVLAFAGCSDDSTATTDSAPRESTAATGQVPDARQLAAMLLSEDDLDGGWSVNPWGLPPTDRGSIGFGEGKFAQLVCEDAPEDFRAAEERLHWQAFVHLDHAADEVSIEELLWAEPRAAESLYATLAGGFDACMGSADLDGAGGTETREPLAVPEVGDERTGVVIRREEPGGESWILYGALVRHGPVLMYTQAVVPVDGQDVEPEFGGEQFEQVIRTMADKVARNAGSLVFLDTAQPSSTR